MTDNYVIYQEIKNKDSLGIRENKMKINIYYDLGGYNYLTNQQNDVAIMYLSDQLRKKDCANLLQPLPDTIFVFLKQTGSQRNKWNVLLMNTKKSLK